MTAASAERARRTPLGYRLAKRVLETPLRAAFPLRVSGSEHIPVSGPVILAANHRSFMDSMFLATALRRPVSFLAKAEYFEHRLSAWVFRATGQIPLRRGSPAGARRAMEEALGVLGQGRVVGVYPEGSRSRDGRLHRGRLGPARLALASGAPIVPVGLVGTEAVQAPGQTLPRPGRPVGVRFGPALWVDREASVDRAGLREATDQVMCAIGGLCGQDYVPDRPRP